LAEDGVIVTLQNGLQEQNIAEIVGEKHTMGCVVEWGATLSAPSVCTLTGYPQSLPFHMGRMAGILNERFGEVKPLLELMCPVHEEVNLLGARWSKLRISGFLTVFSDMP
jgi:2-dehydropantoate 2-reductase